MMVVINLRTCLVFLSISPGDSYPWSAMWCVSRPDLDDGNKFTSLRLHRFDNQPTGILLRTFYPTSHYAKECPPSHPVSIRTEHLLCLFGIVLV